VINTAILGCTDVPVWMLFAAVSVLVVNAVGPILGTDYMKSHVGAMVLRCNRDLSCMTQLVTLDLTTRTFPVACRESADRKRMNMLAY
jgi:hypothetical protein